MFRACLDVASLFAQIRRMINRLSPFLFSTKIQTIQLSFLLLLSRQHENNSKTKKLTTTLLEVPVLVFAFVIQSVVYQGKCHASFLAATVGTQDRIKKITEGTIKKIIRVKFCQVLRVNVCKNRKNRGHGQKSISLLFCVQ